jgi:hypothetical protein
MKLEKCCLILIFLCNILCLYNVGTHCFFDMLICQGLIVDIFNLSHYIFPQQAKALSRTTLHAEFVKFVDSGISLSKMLKLSYQQYIAW